MPEANKRVLVTIGTGVHLPGSPSGPHLEPNSTVHVFEPHPGHLKTGLEWLARHHDAAIETTGTKDGRAQTARIGTTTLFFHPRPFNQPHTLEEGAVHQVDAHNVFNSFETQGPTVPESTRQAAERTRMHLLMGIRNYLHPDGHVVIGATNTPEDFSSSDLEHLADRVGLQMKLVVAPKPKREYTDADKVQFEKHLGTGPIGTGLSNHSYLAILTHKKQQG